MTRKKAIEDALGEVMLLSEVQPALDLLVEELGADDAGMFRFPRYFAGDIAETLLTLDKDSPAHLALAAGKNEISFHARHWIVSRFDTAPFGERGSSGLVVSSATRFSKASAAALEENKAAFALAHKRIRRFDSLVGENSGLTSLIEDCLGACAVLATARGDVVWLAQSARAALGDEGKALLEERLREVTRDLVKNSSESNREFVLNVPGKKRLFGAMSFVRESAATSVHFIAVEIRGSDVVSQEADFSLTRSELEIYKLLKQGLSNEDIAKARFVSVETVKSHVKSVFRKVGVSSRVELLVKPPR